ncbi:alkaline phosphatase [Pseudoxanthomonas broegbernensis]|nr:alkaline phosphatase [Pseudoxanthomonas broegbernensis]
MATTLLCGCAASAHAPVRPRAATAVDTAVDDAPPVRESAAWWYRNGALHAHANGAGKARARNVILFLGDGMSLATVAAARIMEGQRRGENGEENLLAWERFPHTALSKTYNTDHQTPDSAGTMTAIATGVKTHMGAIGVSAGHVDDCAGSHARHVLSWLRLGSSAGMATGIVTTARLTHATPAATYAHVPNREWESDRNMPAAAIEAGCRDIARQLLDFAPGRGPSVALGGGRGRFLPTTAADPQDASLTGLRRDGRDLTAEWLAAHPGGALAWNAAQMRQAAGASAVLGLFAFEHMPYHHDRTGDDPETPDLAEMTRFAIEKLSGGNDGFVLMVESARIDHAHHAGNAFRALDETIAMSRAVEAALEATSREDTLIVVTADHSHTMSFAGYPGRGNPILGTVRGRLSDDGRSDGEMLDGLGLPYTTLSYANGAGYTGASEQQPAGPKHLPHKPRAYQAGTGRPDLRGVDTAHPDYLQEALVPMRDETHGGEDVGVWAVGPGSEAFRGTMEQNVLYHVIVQSAPRLRERLCAAGTCDADGTPVRLPDPADFR